LVGGEARPGTVGAVAAAVERIAAGVRGVVKAPPTLSRASR
jgi:hypothetical protein